MKAVIGFLIFTLLSVPVTALTVIYDSGRTFPLSDYVKGQSQPQKQPPAIEKPTFSALPVRTPSMQPGHIEPRQVTLPYLQLPLFIIGSDNFSKRWLLENRAQLKALHAVGLLVQVETEQEFQAIQAIANGLWISPASGEAMAASLDLHHYPALISKNGIEQ